MSRNQQNRKTSIPKQSSSQSESVAVEESSRTDNVNAENKKHHYSLPSITIIAPKSDQLSVGEPSSSMKENGVFVCTVSDGRVDASSRKKMNENQPTSSATNEGDVSGASAITEDLEISGVSALMTDDSRTSSVIDLTESINETKENNELMNECSQKPESTADRRKSIRKPLKRLVCSTTPYYGTAKERTSKGTPYVRKVSSLAKKIGISTSKKGRIAEEIKKSGNVKCVTFNNGPSMNKTSKMNQSKQQMESTSKKQSAIKMPNFSDIHKKLFEQMESIDVTVRKREERMKAASMKKENKGNVTEVEPTSRLYTSHILHHLIIFVGSTQEKDTGTSTKKVVRKLDNNFQPDPSKRSQAANSELPKSTRSKPLQAASTIEVLQDRSNRDAVFQFTGSSDSKVVAQPLPDKKTTENRSTRRQQAYKARPVPNTQLQKSDRLKGVRLNRRFLLQMKYREDQDEL